MQPYVGEIILTAGSFAPAGWMNCAGQALPISENDTLFSLIGTTYGGDGQDTFNLPDLQGRLPVHFGNGFTLAQLGGTETATITVNQIPSHNHGVAISNTVGSVSVPTNSTYLTTAFTASGANASALKIFNSDPPDTSLPSSVIGQAGGSQPMSIMQPYVAMIYCISLYGVYPQPS